MPINLSLKGLQAFEVAARKGSFAAAADELFISPAAVSQLIRTMEDQMDRKLFHRINRGITLTEAGREVLPRLTVAFEEIESVAQQLAGTTGHSRITISVPPSVASGWLSTRVAGFLDGQNQIDLSLRGEEDPVSFERDGIDVRMTYGRFHYRDHETVVIGTDTTFPVCSPAYLETHGPFETEEQLLKCTLIHTDWGPAAATFPAWRSWFEASGLTHNRQMETGMTANSSKAAIDLAVSGLGVVLAQGIFATEFLQGGSLVRPFTRVLQLSQPYCLTIPDRSIRRPVVRDFQSWLIKQCNSALVAKTI